MTSDCTPTPMRLLQRLVGGRGAPVRAALHAYAHHGALSSPQVGGVLPSAQFCNTLTHSVLQLWRAVPGTSASQSVDLPSMDDSVAPYAVHATWMRQQRIECADGLDAPCVPRECALNAP